MDTVFIEMGREGHCLIVCSVIPARLFGLISCSKTYILMSDYAESDFGVVLNSNFCFWNLKMGSRQQKFHLTICYYFYSFPFTCEFMKWKVFFLTKMKVFSVIRTRIFYFPCDWLNDDSIAMPLSMECSNFLLRKCRLYLVPCCPCLFIQQPGIIHLIGFSGHFVFILKLFLFSLSCESCRTRRSQRYTFLPFTFSLWQMLTSECP